MTALKLPLPARMVPEPAEHVLLAIYDHSDYPVQNAGEGLRFCRQHDLVKQRNWRGMPVLTKRGLSVLLELVKAR